MNRSVENFYFKKVGLNVQRWIRDDYIHLLPGAFELKLFWIIRNHFTKVLAYCAQVNQSLAFVMLK